MSATVAPARVFRPRPPLLPGVADEACRACVVLPARDEEDHLPAALDALSRQVDCDGAPLETESYEVLVLLNNCRDRSPAYARQWKAAHPWMSLHLCERELPAKEAHAGTARALLMDTAWCRLGGARGRPTAILSTDADTEVAPDWIAANMRAIAAGAEAVGGRIGLRDTEYACLPREAQRCHADDARYGALIARLEDLLDPQPGDPWPRHLDHFGASLACTPEAYARAGGMPAAPALEDAAFADRLWRAECRLRHDPEVRVVTSARLRGRVTTGLSRQLRLWSCVRKAEEHRVQSAAFLAHRFRTLRGLRVLRRTGVAEASLLELPGRWREVIAAALDRETNGAEFLGDVDADRLIEATFCGVREEPVTEAIAGLSALIAAVLDERSVGSALQH